jgi:GNAT superfamily N-acetyltransferase
VKETLLPLGGTTVWEEAGSVVGVISTSRDEHRSWIDQLYLLPGWTGKGIGSRLLEHAHRQLPRPIFLYTFQQNTGGRRFYERAGYTAVEYTDGQGNEEKCPDVLLRLAAANTEIDA